MGIEDIIESQITDAIGNELLRNPRKGKELEQYISSAVPEYFTRILGSVTENVVISRDLVNQIKDRILVVYKSIELSSHEKEQKSTAIVPSQIPEIAKFAGCSPKYLSKLMAQGLDLETIADLTEVAKVNDLRFATAVNLYNSGVEIKDLHEIISVKENINFIRADFPQAEISWTSLVFAYHELNKDVGEFHNLIDAIDETSVKYKTLTRCLYDLLRVYKDPVLGARDMEKTVDIVKDQCSPFGPVHEDDSWMDEDEIKALPGNHLYSSPGLFRPGDSKEE